MKIVKYILVIFRSYYYKFRASYSYFNLVKFIVNFFYHVKKENNLISHSSMVEKIRENGFVILPASDLFDKNELSILKDQATNAEKSLRRSAKSISKKSGEKNYLTRYTESLGSAPLTDLLATETIRGRIYEIAVMYFDAIPRITNIDYWLNVPEAEGTTPIASQLWHRDYEDRKLLKFFLYFTDVDKGSGSFSVVSKTHYGTTDVKLFPTKPPLGVTVPDNDINAHFGNTRIKEADMPALSIVFVDTSALHRGGYCTSGERFLFTSTFTSFAGISPRLFSVPNSISRLLDRASKLSLTK